MLKNSVDIEIYIQKCRDKVKFHTEQSSYCRSWNIWINLLSSIISGVQVIVMIVMSIENLTSQQIAIVGACFGLTTLVISRIRESYSFLELSAINDNISDNFNEICVDFLLLDVEKDGYNYELEKNIIRMTTHENKIHSVKVRKCYSMLCCLA